MYRDLVASAKEKLTASNVAMDAGDVARAQTLLRESMELSKREMETLREAKMDQPKEMAERR